MYVGFTQLKNIFQRNYQKTHIIHLDGLSTQIYNLLNSMLVQHDFTFCIIGCMYTFNFILTTYQDYDYDFQHSLFFQIGVRWENDGVIRA